jgi:hypothetical protein
MRFSQTVFKGDLHMHKRLSVLVAASILAIGIALFPNLTTPTVSASSCNTTWYTEWVKSVRTAFHDNYTNQDLYETFTVETQNDGGSCGDKRYISSVACGLCHTDPSMYDYVNIRVWVCGSYKGIWNFARYGGFTNVTSPPFHYGVLCSRAADNYGTSMSSNNTVPNYIQTYTNQG